MHPPSNSKATGTSRDEVAEEQRELTRRVLWKLDVHVLPPLALVSHRRSFNVDVDFMGPLRSCGSRISLTVPMLAMPGNNKR